MVKQCKRGIDSMPESIEPMLCKPVRKLPTGGQYLYEVKFDGYRIVAFVSRKGVRLASREHQNYTHRYPEIVKAPDSCSMRL